MTQSPTAIIGQTQLFREGLQILLRRSRFVVTVHATTIVDALPDFSIRRPDLAICAVASNESVADWIEQLRRHQKMFDGVRIVLLTEHYTAEVLRNAAAAGVNALLSHNITGDVFQRSLELVVLGQQLFPCAPDMLPDRPSAALIPFNRAAFSPAVHDGPGPTRLSPVRGPFGSEGQDGAYQRVRALSDRERQILQCLVEGAANKTIARDLEIAEATVKVHIKGLLRKISVSNRTQAAVWGINNRSLLDSANLAFRESGAESTPPRQAAS